MASEARERLAPVVAALPGSTRLYSDALEAKSDAM
jgi:hypothetical protein